VELIVSSVLAVSVVTAAGVAALTGNPVRAWLASAAAIICVAALALIHFAAPLAAAALLIANGGLAVAHGLHRQRSAGAPGKRLWGLLAVMLLAGVLIVALLPTISTAANEYSHVDQAQFLVAMGGFIALAVILGLNSIRQDRS
jgi:hypothetical protein